MPSINQTFTLKVTPEQFIAACSDIELQELDLLLGKEQQRRKPKPEFVDNGGSEFEKYFAPPELLNDSKK